MTLVVPNAAEQLAIQNFLNIVAPQTCVLKLFKNNHSPVSSDTEGSYTEATFTGYSAVSLTPGSWVITPGAPTEAVYPEVTFASSADQTLQTVYGYYVVETTSGKIKWAELFASPWAVQFNGDNKKITPRFTGASVSND